MATLGTICELLEREGLLARVIVDGGEGWPAGAPGNLPAGRTTQCGASGGEGWRELEVCGADCDSRFAAPGHLFICKGANFKPAYLASALEAGCVAWMAEEPLATELSAYLRKESAETSRNRTAEPDALQNDKTAACTSRDAEMAAGDAPQSGAPGEAGSSSSRETGAPAPVPLVVVGDVRRAMALASAEAWGHPDREVACLGITGTKGKTTTAHFLRAILEGAGHPCAFMGTHEITDGATSEETANTTPEAPDLWRHLANARAAGLTHCVMEVSSQGLKYDRTLGLSFAVAGFLNIGNDHISPIEHPSFEDYFASKLRIFSQARACVVNLDTKEADRVLEACEGLPRQTVALEPLPGLPAPNYSAKHVRQDARGVGFTACTPAGEVEVHLPMSGTFNVENALVAMAMAADCGVAGEAAAQALAQVEVPGRMECFTSADGRFSTLVDYAHNDLSYQRFFSTIEEAWPGAFAVAAFGVSGGKALDRYHDLPAIASEHADYLVLTSDDPGDEDPAELVERMAENVAAGVPFEKIPDRERGVDRAFEVALQAWREGRSVVLCLLGKGRENGIYQHGRNVPIENDSHHAHRLMAEAGLLAGDDRHGV